MPVEAADVWTPPENPDPNAILHDAVADTRAGRYETSLAKHVWYHENALKIGPGQYGVRLSFALMYWMDLAEAYPPAMDKLKAVRDEAGRKVLAESGKTAHDFFHDFVAINRELEESNRVLALFQQLHMTDPEKAKDVYGLAEPVLIRAKEYKLCGEYLDRDAAIPLIIRGYQVNRRLESRYGDEHKQFVERKMTNESATLVALLAVNGRNEEAQKAAEELKQAWDEQAFHKAIETALTGKVPEPWP
ncbi:MAG: hypothetical protein AB7U20_13695 [Planctomycetaceae bacterium]